jgi:hypothetical protein
MKTITRATLALLAILLIVVGSSTALAEDVVKLKNGREYKGEIIRQTDDLITIVITIGSISQEITVWTGDVESVARDTDTDLEGVKDPDDKKETGKPDPKTTLKAGSSGGGELIDFDATANKRVFVIPLNGMVGTYFRKDKLEQAVDEARKYKPDVIVLLINSGGGMLYELYRVHEYIVELRDEFRVVAWIESAISAAAMTAFNCREIYFMKQGHMGAAVAFNPATMKAIEGRELEEWLDHGALMAETAGHDPLLARAMIHPRYHVTGEREVLPNGHVRIELTNGGSGEVVCYGGEILTMTAPEAEKWGLSLGTADDTDELATFLNLDGWVEVGPEGRKIMDSWVKLLDKAEKDVPVLWARLGMYGGNTRQDVTQQVVILREMLSWCQKLGDEVAAWHVGLDRISLEFMLRDALQRLKQ